MSVPFMFVDGNLTLVLNNKTFQVLPDHINYKKIMEVLPFATADELIVLADIESSAADFSDGSIQIKDGQVTCDGVAVHGAISKRILEFMKNGLPFQPLMNFLANLVENPSMQSQKELYDFLEHECLPVTEDGYFLAYKAVGPNYMDKHSGEFRNCVGDTCEMKRANVDDDRSRGCSDGLHAGAINYVASYGNVDNGDHIMIVKINPRDVVSVPTENDCEKLRTCRYEVVGEYQGLLKKPLYSATFSDDTYGDEDDGDDDYDVNYWEQYNSAEDNEEADEEEDDEEDRYNPWY